MNNEIKDFALERGFAVKSKSVRESLTEAQIDQIKYARDQGVSWTGIAAYFKEHGIDFASESFRRAIGPLIGER